MIERYFGATVFAPRNERTAAVLSHLNQCRLVAQCQSKAAFMRLGAEHGIQVRRSEIRETGSERERALADQHGPVLVSLSFKSVFVPLGDSPGPVRSEGLVRARE